MPRTALVFMGEMINDRTKIESVR